MPIKRITDLDEFKKLKKDWNLLLREAEIDTIFLTHDWFYTWWDCFSGDHELEILLYHDQKNRLKGIAPFKKKKGHISFLASHQVSDYCDFIAEKENKELFFREIFAFIEKVHSPLEKIELINIPSDSGTISIISSVAPEYGFSVSTSVSELVPVLKLPESVDKYLSDFNRKKRHELRRKMKRVEKLPGLSLKKIKGYEEIRDCILSFIQLHEKSDSDKDLFWKERNMRTFFKKITRRFSNNEWIELLLLFKHETLMAGLLAFDYHNIIYLYNTAYSKDYAWYSPGIYLFYKMITSAIKDNKEKVNFLRGQENYKYFFQAKESKIQNLIISSGE